MYQISSQNEFLPITHHLEHNSYAGKFQWAGKEIFLSSLEATDSIKAKNENHLAGAVVTNVYLRIVVLTPH